MLSCQTAPLEPASWLPSLSSNTRHTVTSASNLPLNGTNSSNREPPQRVSNEAATMGIGIGVGTGILLLSLGIWLSCRRRGRKKTWYQVNNFPPEISSHKSNTRGHCLRIRMPRQSGSLYVEPVPPDNDYRVRRSSSPRMQSSQLRYELPVLKEIVKLIVEYLLQDKRPHAGT